MIGYSLGFVAQGSTYNFMSAYFVLFMTDCVGTSSTMATSITSIALFVEVIAGMLAGDISDNCMSSMGRRRPFILLSSLLMPVIMFLIMSKVTASNITIFIYYLILSILFRISFASFEITNGAFGAEIATGYDERTKLRTLTRVFSIIGNAIGYILPLYVLQMFSGNEIGGWKCIGLMLGFVSFISLFGEFKLTKKYDSCALRKYKKTNLFSSIYRNYKELCRLKPMKYLIVYKAMFTCAYTLFGVATIYYLKYCLGLNTKYSAYMYMITIFVYVISTPIVERFALRFGKSNQQTGAMVICALTGVIIFCFGRQNLVCGIIYIAVFSILQTSFWQVSSSIFYDMAEVDEFINDKRREGNIMSFISILGTVVSAIVIQLFGLMLDYYGYNPSLSVQTEVTVDFIKYAFILIPSICVAIGAVALKLFPVSKDKFNILLKALESKKNGEDCDKYITQLDKII